MHLKLGFIYSALILLITAFPAYAQEISPSVKKSVVKNFKADLKNLLPFGTSENCELKPDGDANCDGSVNQFDLSIWEVEFNSVNSPRRSDFNNDGLINLLDFGIWRNTFYPSTGRASSNSFFELLSSIFNLQSLISNIYAQQTTNTQPLDSSQAIISGSGSSLVVNSDSNSQTQQVSFDPNGSAVSSQLFDSNGRLLANVSFLSSGTTSITTQEDGISIQINKTAEGAVIEFFRNPDGSLIAIKSWPNLGSYERREPPLSVTIPGTGNTHNVLNIQPNSDGIFENTNNSGNILSRTQLRSNGTYVSEDFQNKTIVQSNSQVGFTTLTMTNNLGGKTDYMFFKGELYAVIQTDNKNSYYIAKPLDAEGNSWNFESNINGQKTERTISDPIKELNANTPDPKELIKYINFYKSAPVNSGSLNFSDGFGSATRPIQSQIIKANDILKISQTQAPEVLGVVKEAYAAEFESKRDSNGTLIGVDRNSESVRSGQERTDVIVQVFQRDPASPTGGMMPMDITVISLPRDAELPDFTQMTPAQIQSWAEDQIAAGNPAFSGPGIGDPPKTGGVAYSPPAAGAPAPPPVDPRSTETEEDKAKREADERAAADRAAERAAAPVAVTLPERGASMSLGNGYISTITGYVDTNINRPGFEGFATNITRDGNLVATQISDVPCQCSTYTDSRGTTTSYGGATVGYQPANNSFAQQPGYEGTTYGLDNNGNIVAVGPGTALNENGRYDSGRSISGGELDFARDELARQDQETSNTTLQSAGVDFAAAGSTCFLPGTSISTPSGPISVEKLQPGMKVYSYNEETGQKEISDFKSLDINFVDEYLILNGKIKTTTYHPFYTQTGQGLILQKAEELKIGDLLIDENNNVIPVKSIEKIKESVTVYNLLNVTPNNNFYAGGVLVHNYLDRPDPWSEESLQRGDYNWDDWTIDAPRTDTPTEPEAETPAEPTEENPEAADPDQPDTGNTEGESEDAGGAPSSEDSSDG